MREHPLGDAAELIRDCLAGIAHESDHLIVVSDAGGVLLLVDGPPAVRSRAADSMNFTEGALWSEDGAGTNAVGTALAADHAVQIFATEHFNEVVQRWTCSAAPVRDPETGGLLGVIDLTGLERDVQPHSLAVAITTASAVESHLTLRLREHDERLRTRYQEELQRGRDRRALVAPSGRVVLDDRRGWLDSARVELPPGGGRIMLPSGALAVAEPVGANDAYILREPDGARAPRRPPREERDLLAREQAALRRLATAVAHGKPPAEIFAAVAEEMGPLLGADDAAVMRFEGDRDATVVAGVGEWMQTLGIGARLRLDDFLAITKVSRSGHSVRIDHGDYSQAPGPIGSHLRHVGSRSAVASPVVVDGRLWGAVVVSTRRAPLPEDTEERMQNFTELVGIVIASAESRAELITSRARAVAAGDEARRRIQRDLHDGAQQRLVSTLITLRMARKELGQASRPVVELLDEALAHAESANGELRELAHGILPAALSHGGLGAGVRALVSRVRLPVAMDVTTERLPAALESTAYFIIAEALTNTVKHAHARSAQVVARVDGELFRLEVRDDGVGGARFDGSSGLLGLHDRAAALNGELYVDSPPGEGTVIAARLPIPCIAERDQSLAPPA
ncbi:MAG TPA: GAF domain-containing protein [Thermoleophilaceae bacterium]|nr:GAF domain-containing protein [Thermoleophilaceae bacterium]